MDSYQIGKDIQDLQDRIAKLEALLSKPISPGKFCLPKSAGIDETKAKQMQAAIEKIFQDHQVQFDSRVLVALSYSTDLSE